MNYAIDRLVLVPDDIDLSRSPLAGKTDAATYVLGAFNPGLTRLANGNLLMMVRVAEALRAPADRSIRWDAGAYVIDEWPQERIDTHDPRVIVLKDEHWKPLALTSISWLLPVELSPDGLRVEAMHYERAIAPHAGFQCYGIEDPRISRIGDQWLMTTCSVSPERQSTTLYASENGLDWRFEAMVLDHQNKDMLIFEGLIGGQYWAQTRPLGDAWFAYPPDSEWRAGPSINLATSPDALHWRPHPAPGLRPHAATEATARMGGGAPPILTDAGWLSLWHGVEPGAKVGTYRTYWSLLDADDPSKVLRTDHAALLEPEAGLTEHIAHQMYLDDVVFTTGIVEAEEHYIVASGESDVACRITHIPKTRFA